MKIVLICLLMLPLYRNEHDLLRAEKHLRKPETSLKEALDVSFRLAVGLAV